MFYYFFENIWFEAGKKNKVVVDKFFEGKNMEKNIEDGFFEKKLDKKPSDHNFWNVLMIILKIIQSLK